MPAYRLLLHIASVVLLGLLASGCQRATRVPAPATPETLPAADVRGARVYRIDPARSQVHIMVYRGGAMARLGHNHVISAAQISGRAWIHPTFARSGFELNLPVGELTVDDREARTLAGEEFAREVPAADKEGTRKNMLRAEVLDAEHHPQITLRSVAVNGSAQAPEITVRITIRGASHDVQVPVKLDMSPEELSAAGEFEVLQSDFGIEPFKVALGMLEVQDRLRVRFRIAALSMR